MRNERGTSRSRENSSSSTNSSNDEAKRKEEEKRQEEERKKAEEQRREEERQRQIDNQKASERNSINSALSLSEDGFEEVLNKLSLVRNILSEDILLDNVGYKVEEIDNIKNQINLMNK